MTQEFQNADLKGLYRGFADFTGGQIHYRSAGDPATRPLIMLHGSPGSSFSLTPSILVLATTRRVIAPDHPGNGDSTPLGLDAPTIPDFALAHLQALDALGIPSFDLYGYHTGASVAVELAEMAGDRVNRVILDGVSMFSPEDRERLSRHDHAPEIRPGLDGDHFTRVATMVRDAHVFWPWWNRTSPGLRQRGLPSPDFYHGEVVEVLKALSSYHLTYRASLTYDKRAALARLNRPCLLVAADNDQNRPYLEKVGNLVPHASAKVIPGLDTQNQIAATAEIFDAFLSATE